MLYGNSGNKIGHASWINGLQLMGWTGSGHGITMDAAIEHGGEDAGPRPMELLLVGLAGCTAMDVLTVLRKKRLPVEGLEVHVRGQQAAEHPKQLTNITVEYVVVGNGIPTEAVERTIALSEEQYCSVAATLRGGAHITSTYRIETVGASAPMAI
jgi:putative redox protein